MEAEEADGARDKIIPETVSESHTETSLATLIPSGYTIDSTIMIPAEEGYRAEERRARSESPAMFTAPPGAPRFESITSIMI